MSIELVNVMRGSLVESIHRGDIVAVDANGDIIFEYGNPYKQTFWRSSAKPFQVIPFIESGGILAYKITKSELALMTSSHGGEKRHVSLVKNLIKKMGKTIKDLDCGISRPMYEGAYRQLLQENIPFTQGNNPCSGKHCGMIGYGILEKIDLFNYIDQSHKIQLKMRTVISEMTKIDEENLIIAIDGCGVPVFGLPIYNMALAYAYLAGGSFDHPRKDTLKMISTAMIEEPYYVAGTKRLDTIIMEETKGKILAKLGAESVYCMSVIDKGIGISMKIEDGSYRALDCLVPNLLLKHDYISVDEFNCINSRLHTDLKNHRSQLVGHMECTI